VTQSKEFARRAYEVVDLLRPFNALGVMLSCAIGYFVVPGSRMTGAFLLGLVVLALLHSAATLENDIQDMAIDGLNGRRGTLLEGRLSVDFARLLAYGLAAEAVILAARLGHVSLWFCGAFLVLTWTYNDPPFFLSRSPVASLVVLGLVYAALPLGYGYVLAGGRPGLSIGLLAGSWWLQRSSLSVLKDFKDAEGDRRSGKRTYFLTYGRQQAVFLSLAGGVIGYVGVLVALVWLGWATPAISFACGLLVLLLGARDLALRLKLWREHDLRRLTRIFDKALVAHNQFAAVLIVCLVFPRLAANYLLVLGSLLLFAAPFLAWHWLRRPFRPNQAMGVAEWLERFFESRPANWLVFAWALGEAVVWFVIPEFLLLLLVFMRVHRKYELLAYDIAGTIAGTAVAYAIHLSPGRIEKLPYIVPAMVLQVQLWYQHFGIWGLANQPFSGVPFKVFTHLAPSFGFWLPAFVAVAVIFRITRYFVCYVIFLTIYPYLHKRVHRNYVPLFLVATFIFSVLLLRVVAIYGPGYHVR
jgi:4-hydroxybenzoate polyprenyltransferase